LPGTPVPKLMFTVFNGGKAIKSKVRPRRFYLILSMKPEDTETLDALTIYYKVSQFIRRYVKCHKFGEIGFKANSTGCYFSCLDSDKETFKVLEDAIAFAGVNVRKVI
jgi:hypothetical protein